MKVKDISATTGVSVRSIYRICSEDALLAKVA